MRRKLLARSDRVKCVDLHPVETWMLVSLYNGNVHIWNYENQQLVKSFEVTFQCFFFFFGVYLAKTFNSYFLGLRTTCTLCKICCKEKLGYYWLR